MPLDPQNPKLAQLWQHTISKLKDWRPAIRVALPYLQLLAASIGIAVGIYHLLLYGSSHDPARVHTKRSAPRYEHGFFVLEMPLHLSTIKYIFMFQNARTCHARIANFDVPATDGRRSESLN